MKVKRAAIYARVSGLKQKEAESIQSQLIALRAYVERQGWTAIGEYIDDGKTAKTGQLDKRDGFAQLVRDAEAHRFEILVVFDIKRLTRTTSIEERARIIGPFQRLGIPIYSPAGGEQDLRSFFGEAYVTLQTLFGAEENRQRANAVIAGKERAIAAGRKPAGPTPYGFNYDRANGWSVNEEHRTIATEILERIVAGESCRAIGESLADRGLRRPRGGEWSWERVWQVATSRSLTGEWCANKAEGAIIRLPPVVPESLWYAAQAALNRHKQRGLRKTKHIYLLEAIANCAVCGAPIVISSHGRGIEGRYPKSATYVCTFRRRARRGCPACELPHRKISIVDPLVWSALRKLIDGREFIQRLVDTQRAAIAEARSKADTTDISKVQEELTRLEEAERAILARFRRGLISETAMDAELLAGQQDRRILERQLQAATRTRRAGPVQERALGELAMALRARLSRASLPEQRDITQALLGPRRVMIAAKEITAMASFAVGSVSVVGCKSDHGANPQNLEYIELPLRAA